MAQYGKKSGEKVKEALHEMHEGTLTSGRSGKKVTNPKQAIAIGLSEAREAGAKVPKKAVGSKAAAGTKKTASKKTATKKSAMKKGASKKGAGKKSGTRRR